MPKYNTYEAQVNALLVEAPQALAKLANNAQQMASTITGSPLFAGPGMISNKYDPKKNYYPNIRARFMGWANLKLDEATSSLLARLNQLESYDTWDPNVQLPSELQAVVSTQYSQKFIPNAEAEIAAARKALEESRQRLPRDNALEKEFDAILNTDVSGMSASDYAKFRAKKTDIRTKIEAMLISSPAAPNQMSMLQKAHYQSYLKEFDEASEKWFKITRSMGALKGKPSNNQQVDTSDKRVGNTHLRVDGKVYRDEWDAFINDIKGGVVGASQTGWARGANLYNLLVGKAEAGARRKIEFTASSAIDPKILKQVHDTIMAPLFMSKQSNVMIYATPEQWDSISQGGRLYKGITNALGQGYQAGAHTPKVSL